MIHTHTYTHLHTPLKIARNWIISLLRCAKIFFRPLEIFSLWWEFFHQQLWKKLTHTHTSENCLKLNYFSSRMQKNIFEATRNIFTMSGIFSLTFLNEIDTYTQLHTPLKMAWNWIISRPGCTKIFCGPLKIFSLL